MLYTLHLKIFFFFTNVLNYKKYISKNDKVRCGIEYPKIKLAITHGGVQKNYKSEFISFKYYSHICLKKKKKKIEDYSLKIPLHTYASDNTP